MYTTVHVEGFWKFLVLSCGLFYLKRLEIISFVEPREYSGLRMTCCMFSR